eukprot:1234360-Rhodomonas_salina.1
MMMKKEEGAWVLWGLRGFWMMKEEGTWVCEGAGFRVFWLLVTGTLSLTMMSRTPATVITTC